ncbi:unnamed protein product, partial [Rotaria sordida]
MHIVDVVVRTTGIFSVFGGELT